VGMQSSARKVEHVGLKGLKFSNLVLKRY